MSINKKELIIDSIKKMNLIMLEVLLDDHKTYQDASKEVFIKKIEKVFSKLKAKGDTQLESYNGFCNSDECSNKGCQGYSFVGKISKNFIDLIFDEAGDDVNDIYDCHGFEILNKSIQRGNSLSIHIMRDEEADFKPDVEYLMEVQKCNSAYEELYQHLNNIINKEIYLPWLAKHFALYQSFPFPPFIEDSKMFRLYNLYSSIDDLKDYLQCDDSAKKAVTEFESIKNGNETQLLAWLVKYEKTGHDLTLFMYDDMDFAHPKAKPYFMVDDLRISTSDFKHIARFKFLFDEYYWDMLEKHSTFTEDEKQRYINQNSKMANYISSLSYHLEKRGIICN
jgi:hypothetical protein